LNLDANSDSSFVSGFPAILRGREGRMNGQIIRYLALNGPSLIYSVAKDLASRSQTKVHYPTVNRRIHELVQQAYIQKAGTRATKAGMSADLYATTIRGDFAALVGMPNNHQENTNCIIETTPKEIRQIVANASCRRGSPFVLLAHISEERQKGTDLVENEIMPEIIRCVKNGYLNLDALDEGVICSAFASLIARKVITISTPEHTPTSKETYRDYIDILMHSLEKTIASTDPVIDKTKGQEEDNGALSASSHKAKDENNQSHQHKKFDLAPISHRWCNELKVFLRLQAVRFD
jgi:hypothetical protein